jgi:exodeoxyribonuclease VII large subunit
VRRRLRLAADRVRASEERLEDPRRVVQRFRQRVDELAERAAQGTRLRLRWARERVVSTEQRLGALSPLAVLERGYGIVRRADGAVVRRAADVAAGDALEILLAEGRVKARVEDE